MNQPTILLIGRNGQVAHELRRTLAPLGHLVVAARQGGDEAIDLMDTAAIRALVERGRPAVIVNAAAYTAVDDAEDNPLTAEQINHTAPAVMAEAAAEVGALLVHYSTDYVYSGDGDQPWHEEDATNPQSVYGRTKRDGDAAIQSVNADHLIFRTSWVYSAVGRNFCHTIRRLARDRSTLQVVDDQRGAPTPASLIAEVTAKSIELAKGRSRIPSGIYHLCPHGETSWFGIARAVLEQDEEAGERLACQPDALVPIRTSDWPTPATRPLNSRLCTQKLESGLGIDLPDWRSAFDATMRCGS